MPTLLLRTLLPPNEIATLYQEFPGYRILSDDVSHHAITSNDWSRVEVLYGAHLTAKELDMATHLRWIHVPQPSEEQLCMREIREKRTILVTVSSEESVVQVGEFFLASTLSYYKRCCHWSDYQNMSWKSSIQSLSKKKLLQIGLGKAGTEIARVAKEFGMDVWGVQERASFHPYCKHVFAFSDLPTLLPDCELISAVLRRKQYQPGFFTRELLNRCHEGAFLLSIGPASLFDLGALSELVEQRRFGRLIMDTPLKDTVPQESFLWKAKEVSITPDIAYRPSEGPRNPFAVFNYNLRQYNAENYVAMKNKIV